MEENVIAERFFRFSYLSCGIAVGIGYKLSIYHALFPLILLIFLELYLKKISERWVKQEKWKIQ